MNTTQLTINRTAKIIVLSGITLVSTLLITSCENAPQQKKDTKESAEEYNDAKFASNAAENDAQYLVDAYNIGLYEIEASKHAKQKATSEKVKKLATEMIEAHTKMNAQLQSFADKKQVSLQQGLTEDQLTDIKARSDKKGVAYDNDYLDQMIDDHEKAIKNSEKAAEKAQDPDLRNLFTASLPALRHHVEMAMALKDNMK